jgi:CRP-like cAMP-binding protein
MAKRKKPSTEVSDESAVSAPSLDNLELKRISLCLAVLALRLGHHRFKKDNDRIPFLSKLGFNRHEIAAILDTTPLSVSVAMTNLKKKSKKRTKSNAQNQSTAAS